MGSSNNKSPETNNQTVNQTDIQSQVKNNNVRDQEQISSVDLVWLDSNVNNKENSKYQSDLKEMFKQCHFLPSIKEYKNFVDNLLIEDEKKFFVIVSGSMGPEFMEEASQSVRVVNVFVFCSNLQFHLNWAKKYEKIKAVETKFPNIKDHLVSFNRTFGFEDEAYKHAFHFNRNEDYIEYVNLDFVIRLTFQHSNKTQDAKKRGLEDLNLFSQKFIHSNYQKDEDLQKEHSKLNNLIEILKKENINGNQIIKLYTDESFIYKMLNNTIRQNCLSDIFSIRYLIYMLHHQMQNCVQNESDYPKVLYRGICISINEYELWEKSKKPFFLQGFTSTSKDKVTAKKFIEKTIRGFNENQKKKSYKVLIEIETTDFNKPIYINQYSAFKAEEEYLMSLNSFLQVKSVGLEGDLKIIKTKISTFDDIIKDNNKELLGLKQETEKILNDQQENEKFSLAKLLICLQRGSECLKIMENWQGKDKKEEALRLHFLANGYYHKGEFSEALINYFKSLQIRQSEFGEDHADTASSYNNIGLVYKNMGNYMKAIEYLESSLMIKLKILEENHPDTAQSYNNIGLIYKNINNFDKALEYHEASLKIRLEIFGENHADTASSYNNIGLVYTNMGDNERAIEYTQKSLKIKLILFGEGNASTADSYSSIGLVYKNSQNYTKALEYYEKCLKVKLQLSLEAHVDTAYCYNNIGLVYENMNNFIKALFYYEKSFSILNKSFGSNHPKTKNVMSKIETIKSRQQQ